jgi:hypothetical protein
VTDAVVVAIIAAIAAVITAVLQLVARRQMHAVRDQLENDHGRNPAKVTNLRDNLDRNHEEELALIRGLMRDIGGLRQDVRQLRADVQHTDARVDDIERTRPPTITKGPT